ncbi:MAG: hypothetical protein IJJ13_00345 [Lachnospiraceae bacterium]|nr:hypothetical protein [Lachnospiraceae bacterium]
MFGVNVGNLNLGSVKGMAEEIQEKTEQIAEYERLFSDLAKLKENGKAYFGKLSDDRNGMDQSLTKVVDFVHEGGELANDGTKEATELESRLSALSGEAASSGAQETDLSGAMNETRQDLIDLVEQNKHFSAPAKEVAAGAKDIREELLAVQEETKALSAYFRSVSVMSLTAAIDAGRMGESASKFVQTAEDIRIESEKEERVLQKLIGKLQSLHARMDALDASVEKMNALQTDVNKACYRTLTNHEERIRKSQSAAAKKSVSEELPSLKEMAASLKKKLRRIFDKQNAILDEMESLGENFMDEQKASERAEGEFTETLGRISFSACSQTQADGAESTIRDTEQSQ